MTRSAAWALVGLLSLATSLAAQPAPSGDLGRLLISVAEKETPRKYSVVLLDPDSGKTTTLLAASESASFVAIGLSPQRKVMAVMEEADERRITFRSVETPEKILHSLSKDHDWPVFLDETHVITAGPPKDAPEGAERQTVIKTVDLTNGDEVDMHVVEGRVWDDVPFQLSPDKKRLVYYQRGKDQRGLYVFDTERGQASLLSEGTFFTWADDEHGYLFQKKAKKLLYVRVPRGKPLEVIKDFGANSVVGSPLGKEAFVYARFHMSEKGRPTGFEAIHRAAGGEEVTVSTGIPLDEFSVIRCFVRLGQTQSFVFVEADPEAKNPRKAPRSLVLAQIKDGKVERKVLLEGKQSIGFPISLP
jgi:hypothetical protein